MLHVEHAVHRARRLAIALTVGIIAGPATAAPAVPAAGPAAHSPADARVFKGLIFPPSPRPSEDSTRCRRVDIATGASAAAEGALSSPVRTVRDRLRAMGATQAATVISAFPEEFAWWMAQKDKVDLIALALAVHETSHAFDSILSLCRGGQVSFWFEGRLYRTGFRSSQLQPASIAGAGLSAAERAAVTPMRLRNYVTQAPGGNDLTSLLSELLAHVKTADMELALLERTGRQLLPEGVTLFDADVPGSVDLMIIFRGYVRALSTRAPDELAQVRRQRDIACLVEALHAETVRLLQRARASGLERRLGMDLRFERPEAERAAELDRPWAQTELRALLAGDGAACTPR